MGRIRRLFRLGPRDAAGVDRELDEEVRVHLEMRVRDLIDAGWSEADAVAEARRRFGDVERARSHARSGARRLEASRFAESLVGDLRLALRRARAAPGFSALALLTFGVGIGLATTMYAVLESTLLRPLPFPDPERLVSLWSIPEDGGSFPWVSSENWIDWKDGARSLAASGLHQPRRVAVVVEGGAVRVAAQDVQGAFFDALRPRLRAGRTFNEDEAQREEPLAVVSERLWREALGERGLPLRLDVAGRRHTVVGVIEHGQEFPEGTDVWLPHAWVRRGGGSARNAVSWESVARLAPGVTREAAEAELDGVADGIRQSDPEALYSWGVDVVPLRETLVGSVRERLVMLAVAIACVLLLGCVNLAGLSLARALERDRELAVRIALGAGRRRVLRQLVTEHVVLAALGGALGVAASVVGVEALATTAAGLIPRAGELSVDASVLAFAVIAAVAAGLLAGIMPALRAGAAGAARVAGGARGDRGPVGGRLGRGLVAAEIAFTMVLLSGAVIFLRSFGVLVGRDLGFNPRDVVTAELALDRPPFDVDGDARLQLWHRLTATIGEAPGVAAVGLGNWIPPGDGGKGFVELPDVGGEPDGAEYRVVDEGYFDALGMRLLQGRGFVPGDASDGARVVVVNRSMEKRFWPDGGALGGRVRAVSMEDPPGPAEAPWLTVVGVVNDIRHYGFEADPEPEMYVLHRQVPSRTRSMSLLVRAQPGRKLDVASQVRDLVHSVDPSLAVDVGTLEESLQHEVRDHRLLTTALASFAVLALLLAAAGVYGLMAFLVVRRTTEIGVRAALGASRPRLVVGVLGGALATGGLGIALGAALAAAGRGIMASMLFGVTPLDFPSYASAAAVLVATVIAAAALPAARAAFMNPLTALRAE